MLLDDIIAILSDSKGSLTDALLKTKVLLHTIGKKELASWVTHELKGYPDDNVPDYRIVSAEVHGNLMNFRMAMSDQLMPLGHLTDEQQAGLTRFPCLLSVESIEEAVKKHRIKSTNALQRSLPPECNSLFTRAFTPGTHVIKTWCAINMLDVENILTEVRSRLLDFLLELRDAVGIDLPEKELSSKAAAVNTGQMFKDAIFSGNNNTVVIGSGNVTTITANTKGDIDSLVAAIKAIGIPEPALKELRQAVEGDEDTAVVPSVTEGKTGTWFTKTMKAVGDGTYKVGVAVAAATIVQAIKHYTGTG